MPGINGNNNVFVNGCWLLRGRGVEWTSTLIADDKTMPLRNRRKHVWFVVFQREKNERKVRDGCKLQ